MFEIYNAITQTPRQGRSYQPCTESVVAPADEPVSYSELAHHLRLDQTYDRELVVGLGVAARLQFEKETRVTIMQTSFTASYWNWYGGHHDQQYLGPGYRYDYAFPVLRLPRCPVTTVTAVKYLDASGSMQTLDPSLYLIDTSGAHARILFGTSSLPAIKHDPQAVRVEYVAGLAAAADDVPNDIKVALCQWAANAYDNRESVTDGNKTPLPLAYECIVNSYRLPEV